MEQKQKPESVFTDVKGETGPEQLSLIKVAQGFA